MLEQFFQAKIYILRQSLKKRRNLWKILSASKASSSLKTYNYCTFLLSHKSRLLNVSIGAEHWIRGRSVILELKDEGGGSLWNRMNIESCLMRVLCSEFIRTSDSEKCIHMQHRKMSLLSNLATQFEYIILNIFELPTRNICSLICTRAESLQLQINSQKSSLAFMKCRPWVV